MAALPPLVTSDGLRLAVTSGGDDATVVVPNGAYYADDLAAVWRRHPALVYDLRNRGASEPVADEARLARGVLNDVDDLETVRRRLGRDRIDLVAHSYVGLVAALYAAAHSDRVRRLVLLSPAPPDPAAAPLPPPDATATRVFARLAALQQAPPAGDAEARCRAFWAVLQDLYVADPSLAPRVADWGRCALPNERAFLGYWTTHIEPSLRRAAPPESDLVRVTAQVLVVHGTADRSAPYAGGQAWARRLPNARLLTLDGVAHAPWIERRDEVLEAVAAFLDGAWPAGAKVVAD
jgi:pimeloyl-ACP methyl ester carboxylesterase